jgi:hypothetical protein
MALCGAIAADAGIAAETIRTAVSDTRNIRRLRMAADRYQVYEPFAIPIA